MTGAGRYPREVEQFFATYKHLERMTSEVERWAPAREAPTEVEVSVDRDSQRIAHQARGGQG